MTDWITSREFHGADGADAWRLLAEGAVVHFRADARALSRVAPP